MSNLIEQPTSVASPSLSPRQSSIDASHHPFPDAEQTGNRKRGKWIARIAFVAIAVIAVGVAASLLTGNAKNPIDDALTHTVARGNIDITITEDGTLESSDNVEIKCKVRGQSTVTWVIEGGTQVEPGDVLVRLDTLAIEDAISERTKYAHWSRSAAQRSQANVRRLELAVTAYEEGTFPAQMMRLEKDLAISESNLRTAQNMLEYVNSMFESGYVSELEVDEKTFAVRQAELDVEVKLNSISLLRDYTYEIQLKELQGNLSSASATLQADEERAIMDETRRDLAVEELAHCVVKADRAGMVIYPSAAEWRDSPDIEEGASVHKDQVLLLMPDLSSMQVKIGVHESIVDRVHPGVRARITLPDQVLYGEVVSVASVTSPAGWWTGSVVKYDTIVKLPSVDNLRPGMSAEVELLLASHEDVLTVPVTAVIETEAGSLCWVNNQGNIERRTLQLGDSNDIYIVVDSGLKEGDEVILDPLAHIEEARQAALKPEKESKSTEGADASETIDSTEPATPTN